MVPVTIDLHDSLEDFRLATGQPWWVGAVGKGNAIDLAPLTVLTQGDGLERSVRIAMAGLLTSHALEDRPAWVRVGAARYFGTGQPAAAADSRLRCPADAELTLAISSAEQREAERRAEACFARAYERNKDWRSIR